jgi:predicted DNA-binding transcriptional regulator AlpA
MSKKFLRKQSVAERYDIDERTVDRMKDDGRLPPPHYRGRLPMWDEDELDASDRAAAVARPSKATSDVATRIRHPNPRT